MIGPVPRPRQPGDRTGTRRDREMGALVARVAELEEFVDLLATTLTEVRRHVQFHSGTLHTHCPVCAPTVEERATAIEIDKEMS